MAHFQPYEDFPRMSGEEQLPMHDYELYPETDPYTVSCVGPHMVSVQGPVENVKDSSFTSSPWSHYSSVVPHQVPSFPSMKLEPPTIAPEYSPWASDLSTTSGPDSPRSPSANIWCYTPPYTYDDNMLQVPDQWGCPSPATISDVQSVSPSQVHYPTPTPIVDLGHDPLAPILPQDSPQILDDDIQPYDIGSYERLSEQPPENTIIAPQPKKPHPRKTKEMPHRVTKSNGSKTNQKAKQNTSTSKSRSKSKTTIKKQQQANTRVFVCSFSHYGCPSTFVSKNEWKRHVTSQHVKLGFYRCDVGKCNMDNISHDDCRSSSSTEVVANDFNRKDLFTQHQRRMHAPWLNRGSKHPVTDAEKNEFETGLDDVRSRCWHELRKAPERSSCGFCGHEFTGPQSWNDRMEHVGRHFEKADVSPYDESEDPSLREWAIEEGIVSLVGGEWKLASLFEK